MVVRLLAYKQCPEVYEFYSRHAWFVRYNYFGKVYEHHSRSRVIVYPMQLYVLSFWAPFLVHFCFVLLLFCFPSFSLLCIFTIFICGYRRQIVHWNELDLTLSMIYLSYFLFFCNFKISVLSAMCLTNFIFETDMGWGTKHRVQFGAIVPIGWRSTLISGIAYHHCLSCLWITRFILHNSDAMHPFHNVGHVLKLFVKKGINC